MELHFKIDIDNKIWLLFCKSLKLARLPPLRSMFGGNSDESGLYEQIDSMRIDDINLSKTADRMADGTFMCVLTGNIFHEEEKIKVR